MVGRIGLGRMALRNYVNTPFLGPTKWILETLLRTGAVRDTTFYPFPPQHLRKHKPVYDLSVTSYYDKGLKLVAKEHRRQQDVGCFCSCATDQSALGWLVVDPHTVSSPSGWMS